MPVPIFVGGIQTRFGAYFLLFGLGVTFAIAVPTMIWYETTYGGMTLNCEPIKSGDSQAIQTWKQSCFTLDHRMNVDFPHVLEIVGGIIIGLGIIMLIWERQQNNFCSGHGVSDL